MTDKNNFEEEFSDAFLSHFLEKSARLQNRTDFRMKLASKIYLAMKAKGWNQSQFAEKADKQPSIISKWLSGTHNFETDTLFMIENLLGISLINLDDSNAPIFSANTNGPVTRNLFLLPVEGKKLSEEAESLIYDMEGGVPAFTVAASQTIESCELGSN
jgi:transcriptional regulator with XRE-family HTH domain